MEKESQSSESSDYMESESSGDQSQTSWEVNKDKCNTDSSLKLNLKKKTYSASKSSEKDHSLKTNVVETLPETNRTREKDFIGVSSIGESSSGVSVIAALSVIHHDHLYPRKTNESISNKVTKKLERKRRPSSKSPRKYSLKKNIVSTPPRRSKRESNKIKPDYKDNSSSDAESDVDILSKQPTNIPAKLSRSRSINEPKNLSPSSSGGKNADKPTYQLSFGTFLPEKISDHSDPASKNMLPDTKSSKTACMSSSTLPRGSAHDEKRFGLKDWLEAIEEKEKHKKDSTEEVPGRSNTDFQKHCYKYRVREAIQTKIETRKLLSTSKEGASVLNFPKTVSSGTPEHCHKYKAREIEKKEILIKKPPRTSEEVACAQSSSKSMSIDNREQVDTARSTEKRENKNEEPPRISKIDDTANTDSKEPTYEGLNENTGDQSIPQSTPENKVGSKRLSDPSKAPKENRLFK